MGFYLQDSVVRRLWLSSWPCLFCPSACHLERCGCQLLLEGHGCETASDQQPVRYWIQWAWKQPPPSWAFLWHCSQRWQFDCYLEAMGTWLCSAQTSDPQELWVKLHVLSLSRWVLGTFVLQQQIVRLPFVFPTFTLTLSLFAKSAICTWLSKSMFVSLGGSQ